MKGRIVINGPIGSSSDEQGVELIDVIAQVTKQPDATEFDVLINSEGGCVDTGWQIYDYLVSLNKPLTTIGQGVVASMATVIFMAGTIRKVYDNTIFMVHLPRVNQVNGTAEDIKLVAKEMDGVESRMVDFYSGKFGIESNTIKTLLTNETFLTRKQLTDLGITTATPIRAVARATIKSNLNNEKMSKKMNNQQKGLLNQIKAMLSGAVESKLLYNAEGRELDFAALDEDTAVSVGDTATYTDDSTNPEGEVIMQDGRVFVFEEGVVTEIRDVEDETDLVEELQEKIEELENTNAQLTAKLTKAQSDALNKKAILAKLAKLESGFEVETIEKPTTPKKVEKESRFKAALNNVKKK